MAGNTYLSREQILESEVKTRDVEAFGGMVMVKEMDALTMQHLMASGAFRERADGKSELDYGKINLGDLAIRCIVDPTTKEPMLTKEDGKVLVRKSAMDVINVVSESMSAAGFELVESSEDVDKEQPAKN